MSTITADQAQAELDRRSIPRATRPRSKDHATFVLSGEELRAIAGTQAPRKAAAKAKKATKARVVDPHTALRKLAWQHMVAEKTAGRKCSYVDACKKFGTHPARKA